MAEDAAKNTVGACKRSVVSLEKTLALVCCILNCIPFTSGVGTMISACAGKDFNGEALLFGICQFILAFLLVGWIWSIVHGVWLLDASK